MSKHTHTPCASTAYHYELTPANKHVNMMEQSEDNSQLTIIISELLIERISSVITDIAKLNVLLVKGLLLLMLIYLLSRHIVRAFFTL